MTFFRIPFLSDLESFYPIKCKDFIYFTNYIFKDFNYVIFNIMSNKLADTLKGVSFTFKENNYTKTDEITHKKNIYNLIRASKGLPYVKDIYCSICKKQNEHFTYDCPSLYCYICHGHHKTYACPNKRLCQFCLKEHPTQFCTDKDAANTRLGRVSFCYLCKNKGHIAKDCKTQINKYRYKFNSYKWNNFNRRYNYSYSKRKYYNSYSKYKRKYRW